MMTIVVPVRNRPQLVVRTLESIKAQTWRPLRVVIVDNASTDETPEVLLKWKADSEEDDFRVDIFEETTPGPSAARARGVEEVDSRLMMHFDSDDVMQPRHVETIMRRFAANDYPDLVYFRTRRHSHDNTRNWTTHSPDGSGVMISHLVHGIISTLHFACETALMRRVGSWDKNLKCWEDYELGTRLLLESRHRVFIKDVNAEVYGQKNSVTGIDFSSKAGEWEKALDTIEDTFEKNKRPHQKKWLRYVDYRRAILAAHYRREGNTQASEVLLCKALGSKRLNAFQRLYLKAAYLYTSRGGRGAAMGARFVL